jgi:hypothetical protein
LCEETAGLLFDPTNESEKDKLNELLFLDNNSPKESSIQSSEYVKESINNFYFYLSNLAAKLEIIVTTCLNYTLHFAEIKYKDLCEINRIYSTFHKTREFLWIDSDELINQTTTLPLHPRVANSKNLIELITQIKNKYSYSK